jgi:hypothetical protein
VGFFAGPAVRLRALVQRQIDAARDDLDALGGDELLVGEPVAHPARKHHHAVGARQPRPLQLLHGAEGQRLLRPDARVRVLLGHQPAHVEDEPRGNEQACEQGHGERHVRARVEHVGGRCARDARRAPRPRDDVVGGGGHGRALVVRQAVPVDPLRRQRGARLFRRPRRPARLQIGLEREQADADAAARQFAQVRQDLRLDERLAEPEVADVERAHPSKNS